MSLLDFKKYDTKGSKADSLVVFVHGYGASGKDMMDLADIMAENLPNTKFIAPNAPHKSKIVPGGYEWFSMPGSKYVSPVEIGKSLQESLDRLGNTINNVTVASNIPINRTVLFGFSQGGMLALHFAPRATKKLCAVVSYAGGIFEPFNQDIETIHKPKILLAHDHDDQSIPFETFTMSLKFLQKADFEVETFITRKGGHGIPPVGLGYAIYFIKNELAKNIS